MSTESSEGRGGWGGRGRGAYVGRGGYRGGHNNNNNINNNNNDGERGEIGYRGGYRGGRGGYRGGERGGYNSNRGEYNNSNRGGERGGYRGGRGGFNSRPVHNSGVELPADFKFPKLVDIGVNLTHKRFKHDLDKIVSLSAERGVTKLIITGTSLRESIAAVQLCEKYPKTMTCTVGVHPHDAKSCNETTISDLRKLAAEPSVCAIGECGLDFDRMFTPQPVQEMWFQKQLELAEELKKPVFLHERAAHSDFMKILSPFLERGLKAVVHCFTGTEEEAREYMKHKNILLGLTATCTHKNERGERIRKVLQSGAIPLERLMIETDAPFMTPHNIPVNFHHTSDRNDPSLLFCVCHSLSLIYNVSHDVVADVTSRNAIQFFGLL